eukprot:GHVU01168134.1.p1 GENE.GHVU01168134.1~~GHVU01168134.1.p1  ORF type:complete len:106 (+),score=0.64 GHVU01168134.1:230-547(+)
MRHLSAALGRAAGFAAMRPQIPRRVVSRNEEAGLGESKISQEGGQSNMRISCVTVCLFPDVLSYDSVRRIASAHPRCPTCRAVYNVGGIRPALTPTEYEPPAPRW